MKPSKLINSPIFQNSLLIYNSLICVDILIALFGYSFFLYLQLLQIPNVDDQILSPTNKQQERKHDFALSSLLLRKKDEVIDDLSLSLSVRPREKSDTTSISENSKTISSIPKIELEECLGTSRSVMNLDLCISANHSSRELV